MRKFLAALCSIALLAAPVAHAAVYAYPGPVKGTTTNDNAAAGYVGEVIESNVASGSAVALTTAVGAQVTSISLTAGDWEVSGAVSYVLNAATTMSVQGVAISSVSTTFPTRPNGGGTTIIVAPVPAGGVIPQITTGPMRVSLSATTIYYLNTYNEFAVNTAAAYGYIKARRVR